MNVKRGRQIRNLGQLYQAALDRRAVVSAVGYLGRPSPAAWVISMQARLVHQAITAGMWLVIPKRKKVIKELPDMTYDDIPF